MTSIKLGLNTLGLPGYSYSSWNLVGRLGGHGLGLGGYRPGGIGYPRYGFGSSIGPGYPGYGFGAYTYGYGSAPYPYY